jgi:hypothetical protein
VKRIAKDDLILAKRYKQVCEDVKLKVKQTRSNYEKEVIMLSKSDPKRLYSYINSQMKSRDKISSILDSDGSLTTDKLKIVNIFNNQFQQAFSVDSGIILPVFNSKCEFECDISLQNRKQTTVFGRQAAAFILKNFTRLSLKEIALEIGVQDHSTVLYSIKKCGDLMVTEDWYRNKIEIIQEEIGKYSNFVTK